MTRLTRILSIDGGGIRGVLPGQILVSLEKKLQQKSNDPNARIADYFDMIAGTSTGGILTCLYLCPDYRNPSRPLFNAQQAVDLYLRNAKSIFQNNLRHKHFSMEVFIAEKYISEALEKILKSYFKNVKLSQLLKPCIIPSYNIKDRSTHFFTQHDAKESSSYDFLLWEVARATSAAPAYFEPARIHSLSGVPYPLIDGGVFANNPSLCAYAEARQLFKSSDNSKNITAADMFILSIGTGDLKRSYDYEKGVRWGSSGWVQPALDVLLSGANDTVDFQLRQMFNDMDNDENYIRISPEMGLATPELDDASSKNLEALKEAGIATAEKYDLDLERISDFLIKSNIKE